MSFPFYNVFKMMINTDTFDTVIQTSFHVFDAVFWFEVPILTKLLTNLVYQILIASIHIKIYCHFSIYMYVMGYQPNIRIHFEIPSWLGQELCSTSSYILHVHMYLGTNSSLISLIKGHKQGTFFVPEYQSLICIHVQLYKNYKS